LSRTLAAGLLGLLILSMVMGCGRTQPGDGKKVPAPAERGAVVDTLAEPTIEDAVAVIRTYYDAINTKRYRDAYVCWAQQGEASRQSFEQFEEGFAQTDSARVEPGKPSDIGAAMGSRYITIPVRIVAHSGGTTEMFAGTYTLRRSVVDGATREQRLWRIEGANIRRSP